eukprot:6420539-Prymnesium_polylepis.1
MFRHDELRRHATRRPLAWHSLLQPPILGILNLDLVVRVRPPHAGLRPLASDAHLLEAPLLGEREQEEDGLVVLRGTHPR